MTLKVGDSVKFLNDTGGGVITRFVDKNLAHVQTTDGFEIPVLLTELIRDEQYSIEIDQQSDEEDNLKQKGSSSVFRSDQESRGVTAKTDPDISQSEMDLSGIYMALVPVDQRKAGTGTLDIYLVNDSNYRMFFSLGRKYENSVLLEQSGELETNTKLYMHSYSLNSAEGFPDFVVQAIFFRNGKYIFQFPLSMDISLEKYNAGLPGSYVDNDYFHEKALLIPLQDTFQQEVEKISNKEIEDIIRKKEGTTEKTTDKNKVKNKPGQVEEVDLHIQEIVDDYTGMSNGEIINIQLARFTTSLEGAIRNNVKKIVFIHGVGNGKLKYELRKILDNKYPHLRYQDASFREYGYGATLVVISK